MAKPVPPLSLISISMCPTTTAVVFVGCAVTLPTLCFSTRQSNVSRARPERKERRVALFRWP